MNPRIPARVNPQPRGWPAQPATLWVVLSIALLAQGCAVGPNYRRPAVSLPEAFRGQREASTTSMGDLRWWEVFHDAALQDLIRTALTNNYDLRLASSRVEQSRQMAKAARAGWLPQLNYGGGAGRGKNVGANNAPAPTGTSGSVFDLDANVSWDIDLWGRIRRLNESARASYFASQEARHDVTAAVIAQLAGDYFQLLAFARELEIAHDTTNSFSQSLRLFTRRLQGGVASKLETSSAEGLLASAAATIPELERQITLQENQISVLLGANPGPILRGRLSLDDQLPPEVPSGLPSALLERRPDIREAEQQLRSAYAQVGVAQANFFPQLTLTGLFGRVSPELSAFTAGGATAWGVAASVAGPIFHGGQLKAEYRRTEAVREQFTLQYHAMVLNALLEVSDALVSREKLAEARAQKMRAVEAYQEAVKVAMKRYQLGNASYYEVLQWQQQLFPAQNSLVQTQVDQVLNIVQFYRALGGSWQP